MSKRRLEFVTHTRQFKGGTLVVTQVPALEDEQIPLDDAAWIAIYARNLEQDNVTGDVHIDFKTMRTYAFRRAFGLPERRQDVEDLPTP